MLYNGEHIGDGSPPEVDIAVDPLEGTTLTAQGHAERARGDRARPTRGTMFDPGPCVYMEKLAGGADIADLLDLDRPIGETMRARRRAPRRRASATSWSSSLDRPRHEEGIEAIRDAGARVRLIADGDVCAALLAVSDRSPVDLLWGIGGTPEGVISAAAIKCDRRRARRPAVAARRRRAQGRARRRLRPRPRSSPRTTSSAATTASSPRPASPTATSCRACATRARGVATTESLVMRSRSGTVRRVHAPHDRDEAARADRRALRLSRARRRAGDAARVPAG